MTVTVTPHQEKSQAELAIAVTAVEFAPYLEKATRKLSKEHPVKGFRPGKVSVPVAIDSYGKDRVLHEALDLAMPKFFVQAVLDHDIEAIARPSITVKTVSIEEGLAFTAVVDVVPQVTLGEVSKISVSRRAVTTTDEEVDHELKVLAKMRATPLTVARPAQEGDTVTVDFKVSIAGQTLEGGESKNHPIHVGEGHFVPGFEDKLIGIQAGEVREFTITFPRDYAAKELQDQTAQVWVKAHAVQKQVLPEIDDDFARSLGQPAPHGGEVTRAGFTNLQELKDTLKQNIVHEKEHKEHDRFHAELSEKLAEISHFGPLPDILIDREVDSRLNEFSQMLALQQKTIDDYSQQHNKSLTDIRQEMRPVAEKAVKVALALRAFATQEKITVEEAELAEKLNAYLARYQPADQQAPHTAARKNVDRDELKDNLTSLLRNQKTLQRLEELVTIQPASAPRANN